MRRDFPIYIPLEQAAAQYDVSLETLRHDVEQGHLRAVKTPQHGVLIANEGMQIIQKRELFWRQVQHLEGQAIGVRDAREKYNLASTSLDQWITEGAVRVLKEREDYGPGKKKLLNERDVAYISLVASERGRSRGRRILSAEYFPPHSG
jgi:predicted site-specific integrase-resolvase